MARIYEHDLEGVAALVAALKELHHKTRHLYLHTATIEVRSQDYSVGILELEDDAWVFTPVAELGEPVTFEVVSGE